MFYNFYVHLVHPGDDLTHFGQKQHTSKGLAKVLPQTVQTVSTCSEWAKRNLLQAVSKWSKSLNTYFPRIMRSQLPLPSFTKHMQSSLKSLTKYDLNVVHVSIIFEEIWRDTKTYIDTKRQGASNPGSKQGSCRQSGQPMLHTTRRVPHALKTSSITTVVWSGSD